MHYQRYYNLPAAQQLRKITVREGEKKSESKWFAYCCYYGALSLNRTIFSTASHLASSRLLLITVSIVLLTLPVVMYGGFSVLLLLILALLNQELSFVQCTDLLTRIVPQTSPDVQEEAVRALIERVVGKRSSRLFDVEVNKVLAPRSYQVGFRSRNVMIYLAQVIKVYR